MKHKWTFFPVVFLGILILFLYLSERAEEKKKEEDLRARKVFSFNQGKIDRITIKSDKGAISLSKGKDELWNLVEPVNAKADFEVVSGIIYKLDEIYFTKSFNVSPKEFSIYGLSPRKTEVTVSEGEKNFSFILGVETPTANFVYIKKGNENRVLLVESGLVRIISRDVFELRDKTVIKFDRREISKLELIYPDKSFAVFRGDSQNWQMDKPIKAKAGIEEVNEIFDLLLALRVQKFEEGKKLNNKYYGFDKPILKVLLGYNNEKSETLIFGKNEEGVFVQLETGNEVYAISGELLNKMPKGSFDLRNKKIAPLIRDEIKSIVLSSKDKTIEIEKDVKDKWIVSSPLKAKGNAVEIETLIIAILNTTFLEFIDNPPKSLSSIGLEPPEIEVILNGRDKKHLIKIKIGILDKNRYLCYAVNDLENQIGMIDYTFVRDYLNLNLEKFKIRN